MDYSWHTSSDRRSTDPRILQTGWDSSSTDTQSPLFIFIHAAPSYMVPTLQSSNVCRRRKRSSDFIAETTAIPPADTYHGSCKNAVVHVAPPYRRASRATKSGSPWDSRPLLDSYNHFAQMREILDGDGMSIISIPRGAFGYVGRAPSEQASNHSRIRMGCRSRLLILYFRPWLCLHLSSDPST